MISLFSNVQHFFMRTSSIMGMLIIVLLISLSTVYLLHPITLFFTYIHELGHASVVWVLNGNVLAFDIHENGSGEVLFNKAFSFFPLISGYFTPLLFCVLLLYLGLFSTKMRLWFIIFSYWLALPLLVATSPFTIFYARVFIFSFLLAAFLPKYIQRMIAVIIGSMGIAFTIRSILSLVMFDYQRSDVFYLMYRFGGTPRDWSTMWFMACIVIIVYGYMAIYKELKHHENERIN